MDLYYQSLKERKKNDYCLTKYDNKRQKKTYEVVK